MIYLSKLDSNIAVWTMLQTICQNENNFKNDVINLTYEEFLDWVELMIKWSNGIDLPKNYVKQSIYILWDDCLPVGIGKLRHELTDQSRLDGGNIGYAISSNFRGCGYGKKLFGLLLEEANKLKITEILATVKKTNTVSKKIVEAYKGKLIKETEEWLYYTF